MEKAYDTLSWGILEACLQHLGFHRTFISKIMLCITSVRYKVWVNEELTSHFTPMQGLRQGDPLSPYLYIICTEAMYRYAAGLSLSNKILFPKIAPRGQRVGLLQFADDLLFFIHLNERSLLSLSVILKKFEEEATNKQIRESTHVLKKHPSCLGPSH